MPSWFRFRLIKNTSCNTVLVRMCSYLPREMNITLKEKQATSFDPETCCWRSVGLRLQTTLVHLQPHLHEAPLLLSESSLKMNKSVSRIKKRNVNICTFAVYQIYHLYESNQHKIHYILIHDPLFKLLFKIDRYIFVSFGGNYLQICRLLIYYTF